MTNDEKIRLTPRAVFAYGHVDAAVRGELAGRISALPRRRAGGMVGSVADVVGHALRLVGDTGTRCTGSHPLAGQMGRNSHYEFRSFPMNSANLRLNGREKIKKITDGWPVIRLNPSKSAAFAE